MPRSKTTEWHNYPKTSGSANDSADVFHKRIKKFEQEKAADEQSIRQLRQSIEQARGEVAARRTRLETQTNETAQSQANAQSDIQHLQQNLSDSKGQVPSLEERIETQTTEAAHKDNLQAEIQRLQQSLIDSTEMYLGLCAPWKNALNIAVAFEIL
jgi:chromosome segregation ATPase